MATIQTGERIIAENVDFETYLREYDGQNVEYEDGRVIALSPVTGTHDKITGFLYIFFSYYLATTGEGEIRHDKFSMKMLIDGKIRAPEPDIMIVTSANLKHLTETYLDGAADLVIEVVSLESEARDRVDKYQMYEQAGVREYWILDPLYQETLFYHLGDDKKYHRQPTDDNGVYHSLVLPRIQLKPAILFQSPLPDPREAVRLANEILGVK